MKKLSIGIIMGLIFLVSGLAWQVRADTAGDSKLIVKGTVLNADGSPYNGSEQVGIQFVPVDPQDSKDPWKDVFSLSTNIVGLDRSEFTSTIFSWLKIKPLEYRAIATHYNAVATGSELATREIDSVSQIVDLRNAHGTVELQFQFQEPHKFITGTIVDDEGVSIPGHYDSKNRSYDARAVIRVQELPASYTNYRDYSVSPDVQGNFTVAVANHGGNYSVYPWSDTSAPEKFLRSFGEQASGSFTDDTTDETVNVQLTLTRTGNNTLTGRIVDKHGDPVGTVIENNKPKQFVTVYAEALTSKTGQYQNIESDGKFSIKLRDGSFRFYVSINRNTEDGSRSFVGYPSFVIDLQEGQSIDLGDIKPLKDISDDPNSSNAPAVINVSRNIALRDQSITKVKSAEFVESFIDSTYFNKSASSGVKWASDGLTISQGTTGTSAQATSQFSAQATSQSTTKTISSGTAVSKLFGPKGGRITSVTLFDYRETSGTAMIQYFVSADGKNWLSITPGEQTTIPVKWNTSNGLRWKAVLQKANTSDSVSIKNMKIAYTFLTNAKRPSISSVAVKVSGRQVNVTLKGKNLTNTPVVYVGSKKVSGLKTKGNTVTFSLLRSQFPKSTYSITAVTPDLQSVVKTKVKLTSSL